MASLFNDIWGSVFGTTNANEAQAKEAYQNALDNSKKNLRSSTELYQAGRSAAGAAAADKAGIAKKQAKGAAMMNGASKLQGALQGAAAATDASQQGYDETANQAANLEAGIDKQKTAIDLEKANAEIDSARAKDKAINDNRNAMRNTAASIISAFSDKNVKSFKKHSYLKPEERK